MRLKHLQHQQTWGSRDILKSVPTAKEKMQHSHDQTWCPEDLIVTLRGCQFLGSDVQDAESLGFRDPIILHAVVEWQAFDVELPRERKYFRDTDEG